MASHHGKQKRAAKHKKRREARRKQVQQRAAKAATNKAATTTRARQPARSAAVAAGGPPPAVDKPWEEDDGYHPERPVPTEQWLALEEREQLELVARYHQDLPAKQQPPSMQRHVALHTIVENQLAKGDPPATGEALERLIGEGMSRHHAIHAIGWVTADHMRRAVQTGTPPDTEAVDRDLEQLSLASWLARAGG